MFEYTGNGVAFTLFGLEVRWYGILIVTGMLLAVLLSSREVKRKGLPEDVVYDLSLWVLPFGVIGARLWYVLFERQRFSSLWDIINLRSGGLAIQGGVMAGLLVSWIYLHRRNYSFLRVADCIIPFLPLAQAIGRWGNFFNNEAYGYAADVPWAVIINGEAHHPTFFYESVGDFLLCLFLWYTLRKGKKADGQTTMLYFIFYGILRFIVEGFRTDSLYFGSLRVAQLLSLVGLLLGLLGYFLLSKKKNEASMTDK